MSEQLDLTTDFLSHGNYRVVHAGDDYDFFFTVQQDGVAVDLAGAKIWFTIKKKSSDLDPGLLQYSTDDIDEVEITDGVNGQFTLHLQAADTASLEGVWEYDIKSKLASGLIKRLARGKIEFLANLTRASA